MKRRARFGACQLLPGVEKLLSDLSSALPELPHSDPVELAIASSTTSHLFKTRRYICLWAVGSATMLASSLTTQICGARAKEQNQRQIFSF